LLPSGSYVGTRENLVTSIAAADRSAEVAETLVDREWHKRDAALLRRALERHDALASRRAEAVPPSEPASGIRSKTLVGIPLPATPQLQQRVSSVGSRYRFVATGRAGKKVG
jgi:hypothetical protein